ncbi:hypothetical protein A2U01_0058573, partial [Trifolium medium]|nr:hypothetical protein [Trifolium medium]
GERFGCEGKGRSGEAEKKEKRKDGERVAEGGWLLVVDGGKVREKGEKASLVRENVS